MANVMLNKVCNLRCEYCFANKFVNKDNCYDENNISMENYKKALDYIDCAGERLGIIGGEPTLHPNFKEFVNMAINRKGIEHIIIFTNGINYDKHFNILNHPKVATLINVNSPKDIGERNYERLVKNLDMLFNELYLGDKVSLGVNIYKEGQDFTFILDLIRKFKIKRLRTSVVVPNTKDKKNENSIIYFKKMKKTVLDFFGELKKLDCMPTFDCNLMPQCIFTKEEREFLSDFWKYEREVGMRCNITDNSICSPVLDILPNLQVVRCFGCSDEEYQLLSFDSLNEVRDYFAYKTDDLSFRVINDENCRNCKQRITKQCMGGCIAFKKNKIDEINKKLMEEL